MEFTLCFIIWVVKKGVSEMEKVLEVSNKIWEAMKNINEEQLLSLIHEDAEFVHMSRTLSRDAEILVILEKDIVYKTVDFIESTVKQIESTFIVLNRLDLTAVVKGNEVTNSFVVTEVYTPSGDTFKLSSLAFTKRV